MECLAAGRRNPSVADLHKGVTLLRNSDYWNSQTLLTLSEFFLCFHSLKRIQNSPLFLWRKWWIELRYEWLRYCTVAVLVPLAGTTRALFVSSRFGLILSLQEY